MFKLNLAIVDKDEFYLDGFCKFIHTCYPLKYNVYSFTHNAALIQFLNEKKFKINILLIHAELYNAQINHEQVEMSLLLTDSCMSEEEGDLKSIHKYQRGDVLLGKVIDLYSEKSLKASLAVVGNKKSRVVSVFSPQGGSGKTVLALYLANYFAEKELSVLYVNLESLNSSHMFLHADGDTSLSRVVYYLKESKTNFTVRLGNARCNDIKSGVSYFKKFNCCLELDEMTGDDVSKLIFALKRMAYYDVILIDTSSEMNGRNLEILSSSDRIAFIVSQDLLCKYKWEFLETEFDKMDIGYKVPVVKDVITLDHGTPCLDSNIFKLSIQPIANDLLGDPASFTV